MLKKFIYGLVILLTVVGLFGVKGLGVQNAAAITGSWYDVRASAIDAALPNFSAVNLNGGGGADPGNLGGCATAPSFGAYQFHLLDSDAPSTTTYLHVRIAAIDPGNFIQNSWAVRVSMNDAGLTELGCALNDANGVIDFVVAVPADSGIIVTLASNGSFVPVPGVLRAWVTRGTNTGGGLIVDMQADCGSIVDRSVEATNLADAGNGDYYEGVNFIPPPTVKVTWLDIPAGTYNLGIESQWTIGEFATYYPDITAPGFILLKPCYDAVIPLDVQVRDRNGDPRDVSLVAITPNTFGLNHDLGVGRTGVGAEGIGEKSFFVNPGYLWDIAVIDDSFLFGNGLNIFLIDRAFNPTLGSLFFNMKLNPPAWVGLCTNAGYSGAMVNIDPPGQLEMRYFEFKDGLNECDAGYTGGGFALTPGQDYDVSQSVTLISGRDNCAKDMSDNTNICSSSVNDIVIFINSWVYKYIPTIPIWNFAGDNDAFAYFQYFGDVPFKTSPEEGTSQLNYNLPLTGGEVKLMRDPWTDQAGNTVELIMAPDDAALDCLGNPITDANFFPEVIMPCYTIETPSTDPVVLANDWLTSNLGPITHVGRYRYMRSLQHGLLPMAPAGVDRYNSLFSISPSGDMNMAGTLVVVVGEAMYEIGPDQPAWTATPMIPTNR